MATVTDDFSEFAQSLPGLLHAEPRDQTPYLVYFLMRGMGLPTVTAQAVDELRRDASLPPYRTRRYLTEKSGNGKRSMFVKQKAGYTLSLWMEKKIESELADSNVMAPPVPDHRPAPLQPLPAVSMNEVLGEIFGSRRAAVAAQRDDPQPAAPAIKVFLSHASSDAALAELLVNLLTRALHMRKSDIRCTSVAGCRLPLGADTDETLRAEIATSEVFIGLVTNNAVSSAYVLFELGARWGKGGSVLPVIGPGVSFKILPGPVSGTNGGKTTDRALMQQLVRTVGAALGITPEPPDVYERELETLVSAK